MAGLPATMAVGLDAMYTDVVEQQFAISGDTEQTELRTTLPGTPKLKAATSANPSVKANNGAFTTPGASAGKTIHETRWAEVGHAARNTWIPLAADVVLLTGGTISVADGATQEKLTQA